MNKEYKGDLALRKDMTKRSLSDRYPDFPFLTIARVMLRPRVLWRPWQIVVNQIEEARGAKMPEAWPWRVNKWLAILNDHSILRLTEAEREKWLEFVAVHNKTQEIIGGIEIQRDASKRRD